MKCASFFPRWQLIPTSYWNQASGHTTTRTEGCCPDRDKQRMLC